MIGIFIKNRFFYLLLLFLNFPFVILATPLKIATYNIRAGLDSSIENIGDAIRSLDPDIIAVQEIDVSTERSSNVNQVSRLAELTGMEYAHFCYASNYRKGQYGHAILSKFPFDEDSKLNLKLDRILDKEERSVCTAEVILPKGTLSSDERKVIVASAHLGLKDNAHHVQSMMRKLKYIGQNRDLFLLGDLNLTPDDDSYHKLTKNDYHDMVPVWERYDTFPANRKNEVANKRIDYILSNQDYANCNVKVENLNDHTSINWSGISDHYPIMITISPVEPKKGISDYLPARCTIF